MRILILAGFRRHAGGVERYLEGAIAGLSEAGHDLALLTVHSGSADRPAISLPPNVRAWVLEEGASAAYRSAREWGADVAYVHGLDGDDALAQLQAELPTVYFAHDYSGGCVSGFKTWQSVPQVCARPLGPACLLHYYPHRCGGLSPVTAVRGYRTQRRRQRALRRFSCVVAGTRAMLADLGRQGVLADRLEFVPYYVPEVERRARARERVAAREPELASARLLYVGRVDKLKGGTLLLDALPRVAARLARRVRLDVVGDGPHRQDWEARAAAVARASGGDIVVRFHGWLDGTAIEAAWSTGDVLVVPSIWPEPFGLVGPEAGVYGVPAAAFDVGGISEWLSDGVNGHLADGRGPLRADALADAVVRCLEDPSHWTALSAGARQLADRFRIEPHIGALEQVLLRAVERHRRLARRA